LGIFIVSIFYHEKHLERWYHMRGATRLKPAWVAWPTRQTVPPGPICPLIVTSPQSSYVRLRFDRKGTLYFCHNFLRRWRRQNPSCTSGKANLLLLPEGNRSHQHHRLLLGVGAASPSQLHHHLHHPQHHHHLHLEIGRHPPHS
jgi:hypothetical protein